MGVKCCQLHATGCSVAITKPLRLSDMPQEDGGGPIVYNPASDPVKASYTGDVLLGTPIGGFGCGIGNPSV